MQIKDLKPKQGNVDIIVDIVDVGDAREFQKFGKAGRVSTAIAKDETGDIKLSLWNEDVDRVKAGDKVHISNGYVNEWQGEMQLTTGRLGKLEVVGKSEIKDKIEEKLNVEEEDIEDIEDDEI